MPSIACLNEYRANKQWDLCLKESDLIINSAEWEAQPKNFRLELHNLRAFAWLQCSQPQKAIADCDAAKALGHKNYALHMTSASAKLALNQFEEAIEEAQLAIEVDWRKADAYLARAKAMIGLGKYQEALHDLDRVLKIEPNSIIALLTLSEAMRALKQYSEAISAAEHATALDPNNAQAFACLAAAKFAAGKRAEGVRDLSHAIEIDPKCATAYSFRAYARLLSGDAIGALADCNQAISMFTDARLYGIRAVIHAKLGHEQEALEDSNKALEVDPNDSHALFMHGWMLSKLHRWEEAISATLAALPNSEGPEACHGSLAGYYAMTGDVQSAMKHIASALELDPASAGAYNNRAFIRAHLGESEAALADVEQAISLGPEILSSWFSTRGLVYYSLGRYEDAIVDLDKAIGMDDTDAEAYYFRAETYERLKQPQKSTADREKARQLKYELPPFSTLKNL